MLRVNPILGQALKEVREKRFLTQAEAAAQIGVALRTWQSWESERIDSIPQIRYRRKLIEWLAADEVAA